MSVDLDQIYEISFQMISSAGVAKSAFMEALYACKEKNDAECEKKIKEGDAAYTEAHRHHRVLLQKECNEKEPQAALILMHAEDQLMSVETIKIMVTEFIELHRRG